MASLSHANPSPFYQPHHFYQPISPTENQPIIIDPGCHSIRFGYAGEAYPRSFLPPFVGMFPEEPVISAKLSYPLNPLEKNDHTEVVSALEYLRTEDVGGYYSSRPGSLNVDINVVAFPSKADEDEEEEAVGEEEEEAEEEEMLLMERILEESMGLNGLDETLCDHPILLTEPNVNSHNYREKFIELLFETFQVPLALTAKKSVLATYACGQTMGLVLDLGASCINSSVVSEGYVYPHTIRESPLGGYLLDQILYHHLSSTGSYNHDKAFSSLHTLNSDTSASVCDYNLNFPVSFSSHQKYSSSDEKHRKDNLLEASDVNDQDKPPLPGGHLLELEAGGKALNASTNEEDVGGINVSDVGVSSSRNLHQRRAAGEDNIGEGLGTLGGSALPSNVHDCSAGSSFSRRKAQNSTLQREAASYEVGGEKELSNASSTATPGESFWIGNDARTPKNESNYSTRYLPDSTTGGEPKGSKLFWAEDSSGMIANNSETAIREKAVAKEPPHHFSEHSLHDARARSTNEPRSSNNTWQATEGEKLVSGLSSQLGNPPLTSSSLHAQHLRKHSNSAGKSLDKRGDFADDVAQASVATDGYANPLSTGSSSPSGAPSIELLRNSGVGLAALSPSKVSGHDNFKVEYPLKRQRGEEREDSEAFWNAVSQSSADSLSSGAYNVKNLFPFVLPSYIKWSQMHLVSRLKEDLFAMMAGGGIVEGDSSFRSDGRRLGGSHNMVFAGGGSFSYHQGRREPANEASSSASSIALYSLPDGTRVEVEDLENIKYILQNIIFFGPSWESSLGNQLQKAYTNGVCHKSNIGDGSISRGSFFPGAASYNGEPVVGGSSVSRIASGSSFRGHESSIGRSSSYLPSTTYSLFASSLKNLSVPSYWSFIQPKKPHSRQTSNALGMTETQLRSIVRHRAVEKKGGGRTAFRTDFSSPQLGGSSPKTKFLSVGGSSGGSPAGAGGGASGHSPLIDVSRCLKSYSGLIGLMKQSISESGGSAGSNLAIQSIIPVGGGAAWKGFNDALRSAMSGSDIAGRIISSPNLMEQRYASWIGASIFACLGSFMQFCITKEEYNEMGAYTAAERKCC